MKMKLDRHGSVSEKAAKRLRKVAEHITEDPRRFDMSWWIEGGGEAECGTTGCIAGWGLILNARKNIRDKLYKEAKNEGYYGVCPIDIVMKSEDTNDVQEKAAKVLGLTDDQADVLFDEQNWPEEFRVAFNATRSKPASAHIGAARIYYFIETGE